MDKRGCAVEYRTQVDVTTVNAPLELLLPSSGRHEFITSPINCQICRTVLGKGMTPWSFLTKGADYPKPGSLMTISVAVET
jgi:hypothetical protein